MIYLLCYMLGFGGCLVLWGLRELERRGVFRALITEIEKLRERDQRARQLIGNVCAGMAAFREKKFNLGGEAPLLAPTELTEQHFLHPVTRVTAGLLADGGSDFFGGSNEQQ